MKVPGKELRAFYSAWPQGKNWYHEDGDLLTDENGLVCHDDEKYCIDSAIGFVAWQGRDVEPTSIIVNGVKIHHVPGDGLNLVAVFKAWRKDVVVLTVHAPTAKLEAVKAAVAAAGGAVL